MPTYTHTNPLRIHIEEFVVRAEEHDGICLQCGLLTEGGVEPDASNYQCDSCKTPNLFGLEEAVMLGAIVIEP
jgi:hypothetical protein